MSSVSVRIALPKGRLLGETADLLQGAGWGLSGYTATERYYRLKSQRFPHLLAKVFHERDIPIQVAVGNYDLGICGRDWVEELVVRYPNSGLIKVKALSYGGKNLFIVAARFSGVTEEKLKSRSDVVRIASEYPNLAESFAMSQRLRRFSVFPLWGAAEVYPPENADLSLISAHNEAECYQSGLVPVANVLPVSACLIANKASWETKYLSAVVNSIDSVLVPFSVQKKRRGASRPSSEKITVVSEPAVAVAEDTVRLALPDGHQQLPTRQLLNQAGIDVPDYPSNSGNRRPISSLAGVSIKVIRPQDMPLQVANGNFDLAITGKDWLYDHRYQFPSSPVRELLDLRMGKVRLVAVVSRELAAVDADSLRRICSERSQPLRVASEYVNIADRYARDNHLGMYRVIPTWGATEAFVPEDADLLIENTETGRTIARHGLKIIDTLFESTACLIDNPNISGSSGKMERMQSIIKMLSKGVE